MNFKLVLQRIIYSEGMNPLKLSVIFSLTFIFFVDGMTMTTVFSYLPKLVKSFGASEVQAGRDAGLIASSLFLSRIFSSIIWGYISDKFGKKKLLLISSTGIAIFTFAFGLSRSFTWAFVTRTLQGASMGVVVITKSILIDICDDTNIALAFSILFTGFHMGLIIGPSLSAVLVFPGEQYSRTFSKESFFAEYAIFLPNLLITLGFVVGIIWGYCTIPSCSIFKPQKICSTDDSILDPNGSRDTQDHFMNLSEKTPLLVEIKNVKPLFHRIIHRLNSSSFGRIIRSKESLASIILYGLYGIVGIGFGEIAPVFLATAKNYGGLAMTVFELGILILIYSIIVVIAQVFTAKTFIGCILIFASVTPLLPLSALLKNSALRWIFLTIVFVLVNSVNNVCFICINVFLGNSVKPDLFGTVNGLGMSVSSIGRALGPTIFGISYSWSLSNLDNHRLGFPFNQYFVFFLISIGCFLNCAYVYFFIPASLNKRKVLPEKCETD
ncbi:uncharacterized protein LOC105847360 isoform X2 [Hydra vulgaris]|uniref:uncharacterized protein LOC105847360 isoform X2 n=1 Tax=Hydra vulgaris TaxID=6087 RepID=UPI0032EA87EC